MLMPWTSLLPGLLGQAETSNASSHNVMSGKSYEEHDQGSEVRRTDLRCNQLSVGGPASSTPASIAFVEAAAAITLAPVDGSKEVLRAFHRRNTTLELWLEEVAVWSCGFEDRRSSCSSSRATGGNGTDRDLASTRRLGHRRPRPPPPSSPSKAPSNAFSEKLAPWCKMSGDKDTNDVDFGMSLIVCAASSG